MNKLIISCILFFSCSGVTPDKDDIVLSVLSKNIVGKTLKFNLSDKKEYINEVAITYLGEIETIENKEKYYIITWGKNLGT